MTDALAFSATSFAVGKGGNPDVTQAQTLAVGLFPSEDVEATQAQVMAPIEADMIVNVTQVQVLAVVGGRASDPAFRVWTFTLDNHDMYVLRLGDSSTLVYDTLTGHWANWGTYFSKIWRHRVGCNWPGATGISPATPVVVGDDTLGVLYFLDPEYPYDDYPLDGGDPIPFHRIAQGQIPYRGRDPVDDFGVILSGSFGDVLNGSLGGVSLSISDDNGKSYQACGLIDIAVGDFSDRVEWTSLGQIYAPGRLYRIEDDGALARIDSLDRIDGDDDAES